HPDRCSTQKRPGIARPFLFHALIPFDRNATHQGNYSNGLPKRFRYSLPISPEFTWLRWLSSRYSGMPLSTVSQREPLQITARGLSQRTCGYRDCSSALKRSNHSNCSTTGPTGIEQSSMFLSRHSANASDGNFGTSSRIYTVCPWASSASTVRMK